MVNVSFNETIKQGYIGEVYEIQCLANSEGTNSSVVSVSWTGPNGTTITNDSRLTITPTVSNGTNHVSTLQFSYLSEGDEGSYKCYVEMDILGTNESKSYKLENITSKLLVTLCKC